MVPFEAITLLDGIFKVGVWNNEETEIVQQHDFVLMQMTGIEDAKGKYIYEGDVLEDGKKQRGQVLWHHNSYLVEWQERGYDGHLLQNRMTDDCFGYGEIIGNVYENPELINPSPSKAAPKEAE